MVEILHHFETTGNHCLLVFIKTIIIPGLLRWCRISSIHSIYCSLSDFLGVFLAGYHAVGCVWPRILGPPVVPFYTSLGEGSPTNIDHRKSWYPYSNLSTGGPSINMCIYIYYIHIDIWGISPWLVGKSPWRAHSRDFARGPLATFRAWAIF